MNYEPHAVDPIDLLCFSVLNFRKIIENYRFHDGRVHNGCNLQLGGKIVDRGIVLTRYCIKTHRKTIGFFFFFCIASSVKPNAIHVPSGDCEETRGIVSVNDEFINRLKYARRQTANGKISLALINHVHRLDRS